MAVPKTLAGRASTGPLGHMTTPRTPFAIRHAPFALVPALCNVAFALLLWRHGVPVVGVVASLAIPLAALVSLYSILKPGYFYDPRREDTDPRQMVSYEAQPRRYWTMVVICVLVYSGMTFLVGVAALCGTR